MIKVVLIDDEPAAIDVLCLFIEKLDDFEVVNSFTDPIEGLNYIRTNLVDLVFLDISMPHLNGVDLAEAIKEECSIIFCTAYPEFAVDGFEVNAIDYLVKPVAYPRFLQALDRFKERVYTKQEEPKQDTILIKSDKEYHRVEKAEIIKLEAMGDYIKLFTADKRLLVHSTMAALIDKINDKNMVRVHRSAAVHTASISHIADNSVYLKDGSVITIGKTFKEKIIKRLGAS